MNHYCINTKKNMLKKKIKLNLNIIYTENLGLVGKKFKA